MMKVKKRINKKKLNCQRSSQDHLRKSLPSRRSTCNSTLKRNIILNNVSNAKSTAIFQRRSQIKNQCPCCPSLAHPTAQLTPPWQISPPPLENQMKNESNWSKRLKMPKRYRVTNLTKHASQK